MYIYVTSNNRVRDNVTLHAFNIANLWILHHLSLECAVGVAVQSENSENRIVF